MFSRFSDHARFLYAQRITGFDVPGEPNFHPESLPYFLGCLERSEFYLEYGSGGSTVEAARMRKRFVSVDNDAYYLAAVQKRIDTELGACSGSLVPVDIGHCGKWGYPIFKKPTAARLRAWRSYAETPWSMFTNEPDLVLVDGRFRVHCALYSISQMSSENFQILVDDYEPRPFYREIEKFASLNRMCGHMAVFKFKPHDKDELRISIEQFSRDYR